jgi:hypothetical protein
MFFGKKKQEETVRDPVSKYGKLIRDNKVPETESPKKPGLLDRLFRGGCDADFVYYED